MLSKRKFHSQVLIFALLLGASSAPAAETWATPDAWITMKTKIALLTAADAPATDVNVDTVDGRVTLHGTVATETEKNAAEKVARGIVGVKEVRNLLQVVAPKKQGDVAADDAKIREKVQAALEREKELEGSNVEVQSVNKGTVLLAGKAESISDHLRAVEVTRTVEGVERVATEVRSPEAEKAGKADDGGKSEAGTGLVGAAQDAWITGKVKVALLADENIPGTAINVDTRDRVVTLFGTVSSGSVKEQAEAEARKIDGVANVRNELQVSGAGEKPESDTGESETRGDDAKVAP